MLITKEVEVKLARNKQHYLDLGYEIPRVLPKGQRHHILTVKTCDLPRNSHTKVEVQCDYCGKIKTPSWQSYMDSKENQTILKDCCKSCWYEKCKESNMVTYGIENQFERIEVIEQIKETNNDKYGCDYYTQTDEYKIRSKETCMNIYGVDNVSKSPEIIQKIKDIHIEKYGSYYTQTPEYKEKYIATCMERYGVENSFQDETVKGKSKITCLSKYGVEYAQQNQEVKARSMNTLRNNGEVNTSRQQKYLHNLFGGELNYMDETTRSYALDIAFPTMCYYIEYSGGGHNLNVKLGNMTEKEFHKKEMDRYFYLKRNGWKRIEIKSQLDYLPSDEVLIEEFNKAMVWFESDEFGHGHYTIEIGKHANDSTYGKLRKIKEEDLLKEIS